MQKLGFFTKHLHQRVYLACYPIVFIDRELQNTVTNLHDFDSQLKQNPIVPHKDMLARVSNKKISRNRSSFDSKVMRVFINCVYIDVNIIA
jgi:hypothetical protein